MQKVILFFLIIFLPSFLFASKEKIFDFGINASLNSNFFKSDFQSLPGTQSCCPKFSSGLGIMPDFGIFSSYFLNEKFKIGLSVSYNNLSGKFSVDEAQTTDNNNGTISNGIFRHTLETNITGYSLSPFLEYNSVENLNIRFNPLITLLVTSNFNQEERIISPNNVVYANGKIVRNELSGEIESMNSILFGLGLGVNYNINISEEKDLSFIPSLNYNMYLNSLNSKIDINLNRLSIGLSVAKTLFKPEIPVPELEYEYEYIPDTFDFVISDITEEKKIEESYINGTMEVTLNEEFVKDTIQINVDVDSKFEAVLSYIFFEENSSQIPQRYSLLKASETDLFDVKIIKIENNLSLYYDVLNVLGQRLQENKDVTIQIVGCNANIHEETNNLTLSNNRATSIRNYFAEVWRIDTNRMSIVVRNLPQSPSNNSNEFGQAENRRVEIIPSSWDIFQPIEIRQEFRYVTDKIIYTFKPEIESKREIKYWKVYITQDNNIVKSFDGIGKPRTLDWSLNEELFDLPKSEVPLTYNILVEDDLGETKVIKGALKYQAKYKENLQIVQKEVVKNRIEKYNLILFGYNTYQLPKASGIITDIIKEKILIGGEVLSVEGFSDIIGDTDYNLKISKFRADAVCKTLNLDEKLSIGRGSITADMFDNSLPEGRFYSRTAIITVENKLIKD